MWAAPSGSRERAHGDARKLALCAGVGRPEQSGPMGMSRRCWSMTCRATARAGGVAVESYCARCRNAAQVFDEMPIRVVLENARILLLDEASRVQDAVRRMLQ
jgi:hypothetical protein